MHHDNHSNERSSIFVKPKSKSLGGHNIAQSHMHSFRLMRMQIDASVEHIVKANVFPSNTSTLKVHGWPMTILITIQFYLEHYIENTFGNPYFGVHCTCLESIEMFSFSMIRVNYFTALLHECGWNFSIAFDRRNRLTVWLQNSNQIKYIRKKTYIFIRDGRVSQTSGSCLHFKIPADEFPM